MRPVPGITDAELTAVLAYLANPNPEGRGAGPSPGPPPPPGPVVASGGVPLPPPRIPPELPPTHAGIGGSGGSQSPPRRVGAPPRPPPSRNRPTVLGYQPTQTEAAAHDATAPRSDGR